MLSRTTTTTAVFERPFTLSAVGRVLPPGSYVIDTEEELIPGLSFIAYRRVSTTIYFTIRAGATSARQVVTINPGELDTALKRDAAAVGSLEADSNQDILQEAASLHRDEVYQQAIDRAENEGMIIHPNWSRQSLVTTPRPKVMSVRFPNQRRSYDAAKSRVRF